MSGNPPTGLPAAALSPAAVPSWRETAARAVLFGRAHAATPLGEALRARRVALGHRVAAARLAAAAVVPALGPGRPARTPFRAGVHPGLAPRASVFAGAAGGRLNLDWVTGPLSADQAISGDLRTLRDRARQEERDNLHARRYLLLAVDNIVGPRGWSIEFTYTSARGRANARLAELLNAAWKDFCKRRHCTVDGKLSYTGLAKLCVRRWKGPDAEALVEIVPGVGKYGVQFRALDVDLLDETYTGKTPAGAEVRMGVELDAGGRPQAYHLLTRHPSELGHALEARARNRRRVPAEFVVLLSTQERAQQTRAFTQFAPALPTLRNLRGADEAVLVGLRAGACQMGVIEVDPEKGGYAIEADKSGDDDDGGAGFEIPDATFEAEPGMFRQLPPGMTMKPYQPAAPPPVYEPLTKGQLRAVASGWNVSYASLTGDLAEANYGSQRGGLLIERRGWMGDQDDLDEGFHQPLIEAWLRYGALAGALPLPGADPLAGVAAHCQPPGWDWIDPAKDADANMTDARAGLNSLTNIAASKGRKLETIFAQRAAEERLAKKYGLTLDLGAKAPAGAPNVTPGAAPNAAPTAAPDGADDEEDDDAE